MNRHRHNMQSHVVRVALLCWVALWGMAAPTYGGQFAGSSPTDITPQSGYLAGLGAGAENSLSGTKAAAQADLSGLVGGQLYIGQGLDESALAAGSMSGLGYIMVADGRRDTQVADGTRRAGSSYTDQSISSHSRLLQGTTPALGTLSEADMSMVFLPEPPVYDDSSYTVIITRKLHNERYLAYDAHTFEQVLAADSPLDCPAIRPALPIAKMQNAPRKPTMTLVAMRRSQPNALSKPFASGLKRIPLQPLAPNYQPSRKMHSNYFHYAIYETPERAGQSRHTR